MTGVRSSVSRTNYTSFDSMGRLLTHQQITDGQIYGTGYSYNLSGALMEETYPSGRVVKRTLDSDGKLSQVQSKKNSTYGFFTYANSFSYDSAGAITKMQLGNGRWETAAYNDRLQVREIGLGVTDAAQDLLKLEYSYNTTGQSNNNGLLREQKITVPTVGSNPTFTATQAYIYDNLNRIQSAEEKISGSTTWKQTFTIDRYGNRRYDAANTTTLGSCGAAVCNPDISAANNRFSLGQGFLYDASGNVTQDATGQRFQYDSENHQKAFFNANNAGSTPDWTYHYDGDGRRIKKVSSTETTVFVYDGGGLLVAEYSTALAPIQQVSYLTTDHLGTPRIITNENGVVTSRKDSMAFGGEAISSQRVGGPTGNGYNPSNVRQDYTGYEKDSESGLEFAQARQYNSMHGRFTSVDPLNESGITGNPQTFNRYAYVSNDPLNSVDPSGMLGCSAEYSYSQCGGDAGFWGGKFGDDVAADSQYHGDTPFRSSSYGLHLQRVTNAQGGNGFRTSAEVEEEAAVAMFDIFYGDYDESTPQDAAPEFYGGAIPEIYSFAGVATSRINRLRDIHAGMVDNVTFGQFSRAQNAVSQFLFGTDIVKTDTKEYQDTDTVVAIGMVVLPGPGGKAKLLNVSVIGNKGYAKQLFREFAGNGPMKIMRNRSTGRAIGLRNQSSTVFYRPKFGKNGVISNVEIVNSNGTRVNIHIRP